MSRIITKVQLFKLYHHPSHVHRTDGAAFTQDPVVTQNVAHQARALNRKILLIALLGVKARNHIVSTAEQLGLRPDVLVQTVRGQGMRLLTQYPIHNRCQRLVAQRLPRLCNQSIVERVIKRQLEQALEVLVQPVLYGCIAGVTCGPIVGQPCLKPSVITTLRHIEHQIRTHVIK